MLKETALKKIEEEKLKQNTSFINVMASQISEMITEQNAECFLNPGKSLEGCKKKFDDFAYKHKTGNQSVITQDDAEKLIIEYYGVKKEMCSKTPDTVIDITDLL